jgi:hypothetical protein
MQQTGTSLRPHVVLAVNPDDDHDEAFSELKNIAGNQVSLMQLMYHSLTEYEIQGRPLARSRLARKLYHQLVMQEGLDPFQIMVTFMDADAILGHNYLATVEEHYKKLPDGERTVFSGSLNTYRGLSSAGLVSQMYELMRCHESTFFNPMLQFTPQLNYSMTLGFAAELNMWTSKSSGQGATCQALQHFSNMRTQQVEATIYTDPARSFGERYDSAKLQQWGVVECAWQAAILKCIPGRFRETWTTLRAALVQELAIFTCAMQFCNFAMKVSVFAFVPLLWGVELPFRLQISFWTLRVMFSWQWACFWLVEGIVWVRCLQSSPVTGPGICRWIVLVVCSPLLFLAAQLMFVIIPTFHCLITAAIWGMSTQRAPAAKINR